MHNHDGHHHGGHDHHHHRHDHHHPHHHRGHNYDHHHDHQHDHGHDHAPVRDRTHHHSRRDFFGLTFGGILTGATVLEEAFLRAGWARAQSNTANANLFDIQKIADGVYAAIAKPQILTNCNAA